MTGDTKLNVKINEQLKKIRVKTILKEDMSIPIGVLKDSSSTGNIYSTVYQQYQIKVFEVKFNFKEQERTRN